MKIKFKQFVAMHSIAIIALVAIIAFSFTALSLTGCDTSNDNDTTHTHQWGAWKSNATQHWKECSCGEEYGRTNHNGNPCPVCDYNDSSHSHSYSDTWSKDSTQHWKECSCGDKTQIANHSGNPCGVCSYDSSHSHSYSDTWSKDATQHWKECSCGDKTQISNHTGNPCGICGYKSGGSGSDSGLTITDIPVKYNGKYVLLTGTSSSGDAPNILSWWSMGKFLENTDELIITNGRITLPMWTTTFNQGYTYEKYTGDHDYGLTISIILTEPTIEVVQNLTNYLLATISFSSPRVTFSNGNAAKSVNDGRFTHYNDSGFGFVLINDNTEYEIDKGITTAVEIIIPSTYEGKPVTAIANSGFFNYTRMTSVTIPNSITNIGNLAFAGCTGLTSITIPSSVTSIGNLTFGDCRNLESIIVESGNTVYKSDGNCIIQIADNVLITGCKTSIIPNNATSIGASAFYNCTGLTSITIPANVKSIEIMAFYGCSNLTSVTFEGAISTANFSASLSFPGNLRDRYLVYGTGTYTRTAGSDSWTKI